MALTSLAEVFDLAVVAELAGPRAHARGVSYQRGGRVVVEAGSDLRLRATVRGSVPYVVELWVESGEPGWSCTCPAAEDGSFCKHCVAVASLFDRDESEDAPGAVDVGPRAAPDVAERDLAGYVAGFERDRLVELVLEATESNWRLGDRLRAEAASVAGEGLDLGSWRRRVDTAFAPYDDYVEYREAAGWAAEVDEVIDALEELCDFGHPDAVTVLAEHAHRRVDEALQYVDDSDGWLSGISERLSELHQLGCAEGSPDPVALARRLVDLELTSELDGFHRAAAAYAGVLGEVGLAEYRRLVESRWRALGPQTDAWSSERFRAREALIGVAFASGDPDELIEVRRHDLRTPDAYLEIARMLHAAGRWEEAVEWARRGLEAFADRSRQNPPLREFLAGLLRDRGEADDAVALFWDAFEREPSLEAYRRLLAEAGDGAATWKQRSIEALQSQVGEAPPQGQVRRARLEATPAGALVEILAYEGDIDGAWVAATKHGCDDRMWLTLARRREATHPLDAIGVYEREMFTQIDRKRNDAYRVAVDLMTRIRHLAEAAGQPTRFQRVLDRVRTEHRAKRNLKALLDRKGW